MEWVRRTNERNQIEFMNCMNPRSFTLATAVSSLQNARPKVLDNTENVDGTNERDEMEIVRQNT